MHYFAHFVEYVAVMERLGLRVEVVFFRELGGTSKSKFMADQSKDQNEKSWPLLRGALVLI